MKTSWGHRGYWVGLLKVAQGLVPGHELFGTSWRQDEHVETFMALQHFCNIRACDFVFYKSIRSPWTGNEITAEKQQCAGNHGLCVDSRRAVPGNCHPPHAPWFYTHEVVGMAFSFPEFQLAPVAALPYLRSCYLSEWYGEWLSPYGHQASSISKTRERIRKMHSLCQDPWAPRLDVHIRKNAYCCLPPWDKHSAEEGLHLAYSLPDPRDFIHGWHPGNVGGIQDEFGDKRLCSLSAAALTNYHTLDGFKQNKCIRSQFWGPEV